MSPTLGCKDKEIRKSEFVATTQFLSPILLKITSNKFEIRFSIKLSLEKKIFFKNFKQLMQYCAIARFLTISIYKTDIIFIFYSFWIREKGFDETGKRYVYKKIAVAIYSKI